MKKNVVVVTKEQEELRKQELRIKNVNWFLRNKKLPRQVTARIRYRQKPVRGTLQTGKKGEYALVFEKSQRAVTPGQMAVLYDHDHMIAGGVIQ